MRSRLVLKSLLGMLLALGVAAAVSAPAGAASSVSVLPNPYPVAPNQVDNLEVTVNWTGLAPNKLVFIDVCKKSISDSSFNAFDDCGQISGITPNGTATGAGTVQLPVFRGQDPAGEAWGCYAPGDVAPAGITKYTTCYVRVTDDVVTNTDSDSETALTFVETGGEVPEAPLTILLPVVGTLAALGGFVLIRRRQTASV